MTYIWSSLRKIYLCNVVFVTVNMVEDIKMNKKIQILLSKSKGLHPWCSTEVLEEAQHLHVAPKLQSAAILVDQSQYQMSQKCQCSPAMLHLPQIHGR